MLAVDGVSEAQRGIRDKRAFIDYVARLHQARFWMPDPAAEVNMADERYLGVWLNGIEERTARWYLKEGIPCYVVREIPPFERAQLAAQETMIDFAAGTTSSPMHWNVNEYDVRAIARGDLALSDTTRTFDPSWIWPTVQTNREASGLQQAEGTKSVSFKPPPLVTVIVAKDRIPWIKPPPVKKAEASRPGAPPHEKKKWRKFLEQHEPEGLFKEVSTKVNPEYRTHSRYDRERRWQILFLQAPRPPPGCVSDVSVFGQPCPEGKYRDTNKTRRPQPMWIYDSLEPRTTDIGRVAPTPRPEDLPSLRDPPRPPSDYDSDSDDDHYPDFDYKDQPMKETEAEDSERIKSATIPLAALDAVSNPAAIGANGDLVPSTDDQPMKEAEAEASERNKSVAIPPAALDTVSNPAAVGANEESMSNTNESNRPSIAPIVASSARKKAEDEVSLGDEDSAGEAMGPQIPINFPGDDSMDMRTGAAPEDPLEFASSYLSLYGLPLAQDFATVQALVVDIAARLQVSIRRIFRTTVGQNQSFWFETGSIDQARQLRNYMHHRQENGVELLVTFANYESYLRALRQSTHTWPNSSTSVPSQNISPLPMQPPLTSSSSVPPPVASSSSRRSIS